MRDERRVGEGRGGDTGDISASIVCIETDRDLSLFDAASFDGILVRDWP